MASQEHARHNVGKTVPKKVPLVWRPIREWPVLHVLQGKEQQLLRFATQTHKFGKTVLILDNTIIHKSKDTMTKLDELKDDIILYSILP